MHRPTIESITIASPKRQALLCLTAALLAVPFSSFAQTKSNGAGLPIKTGAAQNVNGYLEQGDAYMALKMYDKAVIAYSAYLATNPRDVYALGARARANMELKNFKAAIEDYTKLVNIYPTDVNAKVNLGIAQLKAGDSKAAIATLTDAAGNSPIKIMLMARAQAFVNVRDWANAFKDYDSLLQIDPNDAVSLFNRAVVSTQLGVYDKAISDYQAYLKTNPKDSAPAYTGMGTAYMDLKQYPEAVEAFTQYIGANPKDTTGFYNRGAAYYNIALANNDKATALKGIDDLNAYLKTAPIDKNAIAQANKLIAELCPIAGIDPLPALNAAIAANPRDPDPLVNRGIYYLKLNPPEYDKAIANFSAASALDPKDPTILYNRALVYLRVKDWASAIKDTTAALAIKPNYGDALVIRADAYLSAKNYAAAMLDYQQYSIVATTPHDRAYGRSQMVASCDALRDYVGAILEAKYKPDQSIADIKQVIDALTQYLTVGKTMTPLINDAAEIQKQIDALKAKIGAAN